MIGAGTLDSLPHNGAVVTLLAVCGSTHRESYFDIVMVAIVGAIIALAAVIAARFRVRFVLTALRRTASSLTLDAEGEDDQRHAFDQQQNAEHERHGERRRQRRSEQKHADDQAGTPSRNEPMPPPLKPPIIPATPITRLTTPR